MVNRKRRQRGRWRLTAIALVCLTMMANASQGMVLCFGGHGHVAIEPAGHRHGDGTIHYHSHEHEADAVHEDGVSLFAPFQYDPCVDIPLPLGPPHGKSSSDVLKATVAVAITEPPAVFGEFGSSAVASGDVLSLAQCKLLSTIVLQV